MNAQQIFDTVARHLLTQRRQSQDVKGYCLYRGPNGLRCAAGVLIPEQAYRESMEHKGISNPEIWDAIALPDEYRQLVRDCQNMHDGGNTGKWPSELILIAGEHGVCPDIVAELAPEGEWKPAKRRTPATER